VVGQQVFLKGRKHVAVRVSMSKGGRVKPEREIIEQTQNRDRLLKPHRPYTRDGTSRFAPQTTTQKEGADFQRVRRGGEKDL